MINKISYNYCTDMLYRGYDKIINSGYSIEHGGHVTSVGNLADNYDELICSFESQLKKRIFTNPIQIKKRYNEYRNFKNSKEIVFNDLKNQFEYLAENYKQQMQEPKEVVIKGFRCYE